MNTTTLNGEQPATVTLTLVEWASVRAALAEGPFRIVAPIIAKIEQQAFAEAQAAALAAPQSNGEGTPTVYRIDNPSAATTLPATIQPGTPGYFTEGNPTIGQEATIVDADWTNTIQEELCYVVTSSGLTLNKLDRTQLAQAIARLTRVRLQADTTFYVSPTGNDNNDGLTASTPWASITHAYNWVRDRIDGNQHTVFIQLADGSHNGADCWMPAVGGQIKIVGNIADPSKVIVTNNNGPSFQAAWGAQITIDSLTVQAAGAGAAYLGDGTGLLAWNAGIWHKNITFGTCQGFHKRADIGGIIIPADGINTQTRITGSAAGHAFAGASSQIWLVGETFTIAGTPHWSTAFAMADNGLIAATSPNPTFSGSATGPRYYVTLNGVIVASGGGQNLFPGDVAGTFNTGGQYVP